jgi:hypothetical protein
MLTQGGPGFVHNGKMQTLMNPDNLSSTRIGPKGHP